MNLQLKSSKLSQPQRIELDNKSYSDGKKCHHCQWCGELFPESELSEEIDLGLLCEHCIMAISSRGETLTFCKLKLVVNLQEGDI